MVGRLRALRHISMSSELFIARRLIAVGRPVSRQRAVDNKQVFEVLVTADIAIDQRLKLGHGISRKLLRSQVKLPKRDRL